MSAPDLITRLQSYWREQATTQRVADPVQHHALVLYPAFSFGGRAVVEGRVIDHDVVLAPTPHDRHWVNLRRNLKLLFNEERENFEVQLSMAGRVWTTVTDAEGYFRAELADLHDLVPGWHAIEGRVMGAIDSTRLLVPSAGNIAGIISDVDDTLLVTRVTSVRHMLANTLLKNPLQRQVVPGIARAYSRLLARNPEPSLAPMFYLSATPRQLYRALQAVLDHNQLPRGILITKRVTNDASSESLLDQRRYKRTRIEDILTRLPHVRFTLIGDDGEHDPEIFADIQERFADRIQSIWIRHVHPDPDRPRLPGQGSLASLLAH